MSRKSQSKFIQLQALRRNAKKKKKNKKKIASTEWIAYHPCAINGSLTDLSLKERNPFAGCKLLIWNFQASSFQCSLFQECWQKTGWCIFFLCVCVCVKYVLQFRNIDEKWKSISPVIPLCRHHLEGDMLKVQPFLCFLEPMDKKKKEIK